MLSKGLMLVCSLMLLTACAVDHRDESANEDRSLKKNESVTLAAASVKTEGVYFSAISNGCSASKSFMLAVERVAADKASIKVVRIKPDHCKRVPFVDSFTLPLPEALKGLDVRVINPIDPAIKGGKTKAKR